MHVERSIQQPLRSGLDWDTLWKSEDAGLIACWERGRERALEAPALAAMAIGGQLPLLPWKGGHAKRTKLPWKYGTLNYLAMWQGLRGENLDIEMDKELSLTCSVTGTRTVFTRDMQKFMQETQDAV